MPTIPDFTFIRYANTMQGFLLMQTKAKMLEENNHEWKKKKSMHKNLTVMEFNFGSKCKPSVKLLLMHEHLSVSARS